MPRNTSIYTQISPQVLHTLKQTFHNYENTPFTFIQTSHRSKQYQTLTSQTIQSLTTYFNAHQYHCLLMPTGTALPSLHFNLPSPSLYSYYYFYVTGQMGQRCYDEMRKYDGQRTRKIGVGGLGGVWEEVRKEKRRVVVHVNQVELGGIGVGLGDDVRDFVTIVKNINYCVPWRQDRLLQADIAYFESQTGLSTPGFTITFIKKSLLPLLPEDPKCPDMVNYHLQISQNSTINTPFTLCTLTLLHMVSHMTKNRKQIQTKLKTNKIKFKQQASIYHQNRSGKQSQKDKDKEKEEEEEEEEIREGCMDGEDSQGLVVVELSGLEESRKREIVRDGFGWRIGQDLFCFFVQQDNCGFIRFPQP